MAGDDLQLWEFERDIVEIWNRPPSFRCSQRAGMPDLGAEGDTQLNTFSV